MKKNNEREKHRDRERTENEREFLLQIVFPLEVTGTLRHDNPKGEMT